MKKIPLTQGMFAIVDDEDYDELSRYKWCAYGNHGNFYAKRANGVFKQVLMHRQILDAPDGMDVDHIDGNGLNNAKENLRVCLTSENNRNVQKRSDNSSGFKGVSLKKGKYIAQIQVDGHKMHVGSFSTPQEAAKAYDDAAVKYHQEFARTNGGMDE